MIKIYKEFYKEISNKYNTIQDIKLLKTKYLKYYQTLKKHLSKEEKQFKKDYLNMDNLIEEYNNKYILNIRNNYPLLDNINGYPLDIYQSRVVLSNEESTLVIAGAGSGKSLTIIGKIIYLVNYCHINPKDILCISFTNEATISLKNKLINNYNLNLDIYTFHKLSLKILELNNITYQIAPEDLLDITIDEFFNNIPNNKLYTKVLKKLTKNNKEITNLKRLIKTFINLFKSNNYSLNKFTYILKSIKYTFNIKEYLHNKNILLLIINIYLIYEEKLNKEEALDFNDMINKTINILKENKICPKWKYIIIDEYQDTSITKYLLIKEIININKSKILCVGDDFQSIYRFTGCNLNIFLNYTKYFNNAKILNIVNTYRNPQELINVAGSFIMQNKLQQRKTLISPKHLSYPIKIYLTNNKKNIFKSILELNKDKEILVIGRNNKDINYYLDEEITIKETYYMYKEIKFNYLTIHKSKGLESEIVIIINMDNTLTSLPTKIKNEKILKYVNNTKDYYPYEEERRLFYVALTRTKTYTYLIASKNNYSIFIKELLKYKKYIQVIKK